MRWLCHVFCLLVPRRVLFPYLVFLFLNSLKLFFFFFHWVVETDCVFKLFELLDFFHSVSHLGLMLNHFSSFVDALRSLTDHSRVPFFYLRGHRLKYWLLSIHKSHFVVRKEPFLWCWIFLSHFFRLLSLVQLDLFLAILNILHVLLIILNSCAINLGLNLLHWLSSCVDCLLLLLWLLVSVLAFFVKSFVTLLLQEFFFLNIL